MPKAVIVNPRAGQGLLQDQLQRLLAVAEKLPETTLHVLQPGDDVSQLVRRFVEEGAECVAAAGGDGTISSVANVLAGTPAALVPVPFGTANHFCRDAGVTADPVEALTAVSSDQAVERTIDVACVNGRYFLDNSSLGLYPHLVKRRLKRHHRIGKWPAYILAGFELARHPIQLTVQMDPEEGGRPTEVGLIFVSNNVMDAIWPTPGHRARLDEGVLQVFVVKNGGFWSMLRSAAAFLRGRTDRSPVINEHRLREFTVEVHRHSGPVRVSADGEIFTAQPPIHYNIVPGALRLRLIPRREPQGKDNYE